MKGLYHLILGGFPKMQKRILALLLITAVAGTAILSLFLAIAPIQAAPMEAGAQTNTAPDSIDETEYFSAFLGGDQEVPAVSTDANGVARFTLVNTDTLNYEVAVNDIISITAAHIHMGATGVNGPVVHTLYSGTGDFDEDNPLSGTLMLTQDQADDLRAGDYYVNVHTAGHPPGEIRGQIGKGRTTAYQTVLSGANEPSILDSRASGQAFLTLSADMTQLYYRVLVADIEDITASHIHEAPPGENGGVVFTLFGGSGDFDPQNPVSGVLSPTISQVTVLLAGDYYINVHTAEHPPGEIRGQLAPFTPRTNSHALLTGDQEVPPVDTTAVGVGRFELSDDLSDLSYYVAVDDIMNITASHLHTAQPGQNGGVAHTLYAGAGTFGPGSPISDVLAIDTQSVLDLISGNYYINVHTTDSPAGEIRGQVIGASPFAATLTGDQEVPPVTSDASGKAKLAVNDDATKLHYRVMVKDIEGVTASHIHEGAVGQSGPVVFPLYTGSGDFDEDNPISGMLDLTDENIFDLLSGAYYINVHTVDNPPGEIRGQVVSYAPAAHYEAKLAGDQEVPPVTTNAHGQGDFTLDSIRNTLHYYMVVSEITDITASHIHLGPKGQNGPVVFGLYSGSGMFDPDHPVGSGVTLNAENLVDLLTGYYYVNVHTEGYPSGQIRGQVGQKMHYTYLPAVFKN
jgi:hypothetical protein